ncbi:MAG: response regulator [Alphaproteobacteria bacterium]|nr:MAG: response regulator [Alphaproteobacteria bacterium]
MTAAGVSALSEKDAEEEQQIASEMARLARGYLKILGIAFAFYFTRRAVEAYFTYEDGAHLVSVLHLLSGLTGGVISIHAWRGRIRDRLVEPVLVGYCVLLVVNVYANLYVTENQEQLMNASYAMIVFGLANVTLRGWLVTMILCLIGLLWGASYVNAFELFKILPLLAGGVGLSTVAFFTRVPVMRRRIELEVKLGGETEKLRAASIAKDRFLANMTHELRTPMTGVLGMLDLMGDTKLDRQQREMLETAQSSARYLLTIINDILDFAKLEAGKIRLRPEATDPVVLTRDIVALFRGEATAKRVRIEVDLPAEGALVAAFDPVRVGQVLLNLISNAVKYTGEGRVLVRLRMHGQDGTQRLCWDICDTGAGIPRERIKTLFERFEQLDNSSVRPQGTGLGLAIIRELTVLLGGEVSVDSQLGVGSTFHFRLPYEKAELPDVAQPVLPATKQDDTARVLKVLVVEDNPVNRAIIQRMAQREGWDVALAADGAEAVDLVRLRPDVYDVVLMDIQMPVMDGVTATRTILETVANPPPIIALTANTMDNDLETYLQVGMKACVGKPINRTELCRAVSEALAAGRAAQHPSFV